jgi:8-oxo-dGTP pyrophosphatase MutT (NUDIX family)
MAAGSLFVAATRVLLVRKTYGNRWDIPGGYVDRGESPKEACRRELREEIGIERTPIRMLVHDWAPSAEEGDKLLYVFDCGALGPDEHRIRLDGSELDQWRWIDIAKIDDYVVPRLSRRLNQAYQAYELGATFYLEHGEPALSG